MWRSDDREEWLGLGRNRKGFEIVIFILCNRFLSAFTKHQSKDSHSSLLKDKGSLGRGWKGNSQEQLAGPPQSFLCVSLPLTYEWNYSVSAESPASGRLREQRRPKEGGSSSSQGTSWADLLYHTELRSVFSPFLHWTLRGYTWWLAAALWRTVFKRWHHRELSPTCVKCAQPTHWRVGPTGVTRARIQS